MFPLCMQNFIRRWVFDLNLLYFTYFLYNTIIKYKTSECIWFSSNQATDLIHMFTALAGANFAHSKITTRSTECNCCTFLWSGQNASIIRHVEWPTNRSKINQSHVMTRNLQNTAFLFVEDHSSRPQRWCLRLRPRREWTTADLTILGQLLALRYANYPQVQGISTPIRFRKGPRCQMEAGTS